MTWLEHWSLQPEDIEVALEEARKSFLRHQQTQGHYKNTPRTHAVGKLGELAADQWFRFQGFEVVSNWLDPNKEYLADLVVEGVTIEVKTWSLHFWAEFGRGIAVAQFEKVARKAVAVLWVTLDTSYEQVSRADLTFRGYSMIDDIRAAPVVETTWNGQTVPNRQVTTARPIEQLIYGLNRLAGRREHNATR